MNRTDEILKEGLKHPLSNTRLTRLLRKTIVTMRKSAKARGDMKTYNELKGNATQLAREIVTRTTPKEVRK